MQASEALYTFTRVRPKGSHEWILLRMCQILLYFAEVLSFRHLVSGVEVIRADLDLPAGRPLHQSRNSQDRNRTGPFRQTARPIPCFWGWEFRER